MMAQLSNCQRVACRGRAGHSLVAHWTPPYLLEMWAVIQMHAERGRCGCDGGVVFRCLWDVTVATVRLHARS